ncbi:hypothetical protein K440DRAFT_596776 [Wilcoxina mikolae CBS 423.85]|nr:hypothetical protein K440DRAFT_596776 [Wilcoxina mikolae CBS 423.85]
MWLRDFLPKDVKNVRVMTYGYDRLLDGYEKGGVALSGCARGLIEQLENSRRMAKDRPIIFIAHSSGGLLVKQVLVQARSIFDSTRGIFFFGSPHQGLRNEELAGLVKVNSDVREANLIMQLKEDSEFFANQLEDSQELEVLNQKVVIFSETVEASSVKNLASDDLALQSQTVQRFVGHWIPVNKPYKDSVWQFGSPVDTTYLTAIKHMRECIARSSAQEILQSAIESIGPDQFLQILSPIDQESHKSTLQTSDCDDPKLHWIFKNMDFEQWHSGGSQVLWLSGPSECGIHHAVPHIVDLTRSEDSETRPIVLYFFCSTATNAKSVGAAFIHALLQQFTNYLSPLKKKSVVTAFLRVLLDALLSRDSDIDADLKKGCSPETTIRKTLDALSGSDHWHANAIKQILHIDQAQGLTIIIDGLDEARDQTTDFIRDICSLIAHLKQQTCKFKTLLTSRRPQTDTKVLLDLEGLTRIEYDVERKEGTCSWFWNHSEYQKWFASPSSGLLFISGKPGCGKSVLAKKLIDHLQRESDASVASFFYARREGGCHTSHRSMLQSLLYDVLNQNESLFPLFQRDYRDYKALLPERCEWPSSSLEKMLLSLRDSWKAGRFFIVIDGFDESDSQGRRDITRLLSELCSKKSVKIFVTSRPVVEISNYSKGPYQVIRMQDENKSDIRDFVNSSTSQIGFPESTLQQVREYIIEHSQGVFLWVCLVVDNLCRYAEAGCTLSEIINSMRTLPRELEGLYENILRELEVYDKSDVVLGIRIFQLTLFACRPLTVPELQHALAIPDDPDTEFSLSIKFFEYNQIFGIENRIIRCCGNLVEIKRQGGTTSVQLMHQTAREFLLQHHKSEAVSRLSMSENDAHVRIATTCLRYLTLWAGRSATHGTIFQSVERWKSETFEAYVRYLDERPLINYALSHLRDHTSRCSEDTDIPGVISRLACELIPGSSQYYLLENWITPYWNKSPPSCKVTETAKDFRNQVLLAAVRTGFYRVAEALLAAGARLETPLQVIPPSIRSTPHAATENENESMIKLLLDRASMDTKDFFERGTMPHQVAQRDHETMARLLLERCAYNEGKDNHDKTALHSGTTQGREAIVQLLLNCGADINVAANSKFMRELLSPIGRKFATTLFDRVASFETPEIRSTTLRQDREQWHDDDTWPIGDHDEFFD